MQKESQIARPDMITVVLLPPDIQQTPVVVAGISMDGECFRRMWCGIAFLTASVPNESRSQLYQTQTMYSTMCSSAGSDQRGGHRNLPLSRQATSAELIASIRFSTRPEDVLYLPLKDGRAPHTMMITTHQPTHPPPPPLTMPTPLTALRQHAALLQPSLVRGRAIWMEITPLRLPSLGFRQCPFTPKQTPSSHDACHLPFPPPCVASPRAACCFLRQGLSSEAARDV
jgi:hypothetical protein